MDFGLIASFTSSGYVLSSCCTITTAIGSYPMNDKSGDLFAESIHFCASEVGRIGSPVSSFRSQCDGQPAFLNEVARVQLWST